MSTGITWRDSLRPSVKIMTCILMALKPKFADEILTGLKKCEVRTFMGPISKGDKVLVYYSSPVKAVKGYFTAGDSIVVGSSELLNVLGSRCGNIPSDNLEYIMTRYLGSKRKILILGIINPVIFPKAVPLTELRKLNVKVPRSYTKVGDEACQEIMIKAL